MFNWKYYDYRIKLNNISDTYHPERLQKWLREIHEIHVEIYCNHSGWGWILTKLNGTTIKELDLNQEFYKSYEDALEAGINEGHKITKEK